jgi:hypothetical protein
VVTSGSRKARNFQKRAGASRLWSFEVGSKMKWNQRCASANRCVLLRCTATVSGTWKSSSQL